MTLYLKYRPKDFESLIGQDFIKNTLKQAVKDNKTVWAYLFCWPKWTWKTSTARILAKSVNCKNLVEWNPCNKCETCIWINTESLIDVVEIDAASNTWVDNIREIISKANFKPTSSKYKIYIIDEVHMLSIWAFNALLKILEEPPEFIKFILATTETHKIPDTIISRCQRYDFKNISSQDLKEKLLQISKEEKVDIEEQALEYIVNSSAWAARNAISLFEQLIIDNKVTYKNLEENLWLSSKNLLKEFLNKLLEKDFTVIDDYEIILNSWKNIKLFFKDLIFYTKNSTVEKIKLWEKNISSSIKILEILDETYSKTKNSLDETTTFLIWILKILEENWDFELLTSIKKEIPKIVKEEQDNIEEISKKQDTIKQSLNIEDIWEIFSDSKQPEDKNQEIWDKKPSFDKENFLKQLKTNWVKWLIVSSLKQSEINLDWNELKIKIKTEFVKRQLETAENIKIIKNILEEIGLGHIEVKIN